MVIWKVAVWASVFQLGVTAGLVGADATSVPGHASADFGTTRSGETVTVHTLTNGGGMTVRVMDYGATLLTVDVPGRDGKVDTVTLALDRLADYLGGHPLLGSVVGRFANRIDDGGFTIDGRRYTLKSVNPETGVHIHGGRGGLQRQMWKSAPVKLPGYVGVELVHQSPDGHEGFPGTLDVTVRYLLGEANELRMEYEATTDKPTHVNLTNHAYWNLSGAGSGDVLGHELTLNADGYLEIDARKIPTGKTVPVAGTPFDFRSPAKIGARIAEVGGGGYDHAYVLAGERGGDGPVLAGVLKDPRSGRVMEVYTTAPGCQLYTANYLSDKLGFRGKPFGRHHAVCLECQHFPDSPNQPAFPTTLLRPGETYRQTTVHRFMVEGEG